MISGSCLEESAALARESLSAAGVRTVSEKKLVNGLQVILSMGGRSCGMNYYWSVRKGFSAVPAGGDSNLIEFAMGALSGEAALPPVVEGFRIGTDEAGKGDWFGPLVAAGVACDDGVVRELVAMGVADSKTLSNDRVQKLASALTARPGLAWEVRSISPQEYNSLFKQYAANQGISEEAVRQKYIDQVPMKRACQYRDVTNLVVVLASGDSSYMTGQAINVTGGQEMR